MANELGALSALSPLTIGGNPKATQEYLDALSKVVTSLDNRNKPNFFSMAGTLFDPGRTGSSGEALGKLSTEVGRQQEAREAQEVPQAVMRAQIAGQKYELQNQSQALSLLAQTLGLPVEQVEKGLQTGSLPPNSATKLAQIYPVVQQLSPKVGEIIKNTFGMQKDLIGLATEDRKAGMQEADLVAKYGSGILNLMPGRTATPAPTSALGNVLGKNDMAPNPSPSTAKTGTTPNQTLAQNVVNNMSDTSGMPLAAQGEIAKKRVEESDKPWVAKRDEIINYTPQLLEQSNSNLKNLDYLARQHADVLGIMQKQGLVSALAQAAQEGATLSLNDYTMKASLPIRTFLQGLTLTPEKQQAVRDISRILSTEFLSNVKANKGLLGVNPTDNDARLLQAPMASIDDSAKSMQQWARTQLLLNKQRGALYDAFQNHSERYGPTAPPASFFRPKSEYERINKEYADYRNQLFRQFNR
jgi:hypothetical protein